LEHKGWGWVCKALVGWQRRTSRLFKDGFGTARAVAG
jgi:hypothetical protein